jgi:predicted N-acetyltransferase YhbS
VRFLTQAAEDQIGRIYRESHALWGSGLSFANYLGLWQDLSASDWGTRRTAMYVWADGRGSLFSSVKLYRPRLRVHGRTLGGTVVGALFTPMAERGRGYASELLQAVFSKAREEGDRLVLLFSDIGPDYYVSRGFVTLPAEEDWGTLPRNPGAPRGWSLRPMVPADQERVHRAHDAFCRRRPLAVMRDPDHWHYLELRSQRFFERLGSARVRQQRQVALCGNRFVGYLVTVEGRGEWNVREVGASEGDPATLADVLRLGAAQARNAGLRAFYTWLPPEVRDHLPDWGIRTRPRQRAMPMIRALDPAVDLSCLTTPQQAYLPFQDQF